VSPRDSDAYLSKAKEYLHAARVSLEAANNTAAAGNAVHAGIAAADAISAGRSGSVWRGQHGQASAHLEANGGKEGQQGARHLRRLIAMKTTAEYDPDPISAAQARAAVLAAERIVMLADQVNRSVDS
jgi:hypothetical protein